MNGGTQKSKGSGRGRSGRSGKKKRNTRSQQQRQRRLKREREREEELRQQELREEQPSDIEWRWEQDVLDPVITQATPEEIERTSKAHARSSEPSHFELWQQAQERDKELSKRLAEEAAQKKREEELEAAAQEQEQEQEELASVASPEEAVKEQEAEETGSDVDTEEELEDILRDTDEQLRELQEEEEKTSGVSPFTQSSTVETGYESQEREPEIETKVASPFTSSPAARLEEQSSSESEYESDVTREGDPSGFTPFGQYSETEANPNDPSAFTSQDLPFGQESESESEGELGRQWSTELREPSEWEKEEKPEEQKKKGFLSGLKSKL